MAPSELPEVVTFRKMPSSDLCLQQRSQDITRGRGDSRDGVSGGCVPSAAPQAHVYNLI